MLTIKMDCLFPRFSIGFSRFCCIPLSHLCFVGKCQPFALIISGIRFSKLRVTGQSLDESLECKLSARISSGSSVNRNTTLLWLTTARCPLMFAVNEGFSSGCPFDSKSKRIIDDCQRKYIVALIPGYGTLGHSEIPIGRVPAADSCHAGAQSQFRIRIKAHTHTCNRSPTPHRSVTTLWHPHNNGNNK
ncbi:uncharacterized protein LOC113566138 [Drosophila persimilis]|uniref:uncharacterized protein LOC113566138 n=1 Tax=Drosophila persimilis TaxID=7234 RepID=UPI000F087378|nr:uncharacterized protein LOC113566138 [Drosophila persimilis]